MLLLARAGFCVHYVSGVFCVFLVVSSSAIDCLEILVSVMTCYVLSETLSPTHSLTHCCVCCLVLLMCTYFMLTAGYNEQPSIVSKHWYASRTHQCHCSSARSISNAKHWVRESDKWSCGADGSRRKLPQSNCRRWNVWTHTDYRSAQSSRFCAESFHEGNLISVSVYIEISCEMTECIFSVSVVELKHEVE